MNNVMKYQVALDKLAEVNPLLEKESQEELKAKSEEFMDDVRESQYVKVPIVGVFNAGKSSLINVFSQKPGMLPVETTPETAVAYELYYANNECVELYRDGKMIDSKPLSEIKMLNTEPGDIAKVYCESEPIKELQQKGIIIVDMPGIGSGIERHDAAIFNYIGKGSAFALIVDAEQGSLRGSTLAFMHELSQYNMHPAVFVSKTDKKPEKDIKEIMEYVRYQLTNIGDTNPFVGTVCSVNNDTNGLNKYLDSIDPVAIAREKLGNKLRLLINSVIRQIQICVDLRSKDISNIDEKIKKIEEEISNVKAESPASDADADAVEKSTQDVLDNVHAALEAKATDIAQMIIDKEDSESIKSAIISIVRAEIITSLKEESEQYSNVIGNAIQEEIKDMETIEVDADFLGDYADIINWVTAIVGQFMNFGGIWGKLAKILLPLLPDVLKRLFRKSDDDVLEEVRSNILTNCIDKITDAIRPAILKITEENQKRIREKMQAELISNMEKVKEGLREKMADANKSKGDVEVEISRLTNAISQLNSIMSEI